MVEEFEANYGPCDRSEFEGEFVVPPELRSRTNSVNLRSLKLHGGFLGLSKSRTFLTLPHRHSHNIHASVPDLSRSVPTTPGSNHKLSLASSYDSVLEEPENSHSKSGKKSKPPKKVKQYFYADQSVQLRRKSDDYILGDGVSSRHSNKHSILRKNVKEDLTPREFTSLQINHMRQSSEPSNRYIPVRVQLKKQSPLSSMLTSMGRQPRLSAGKSVPSLYSIESSNDNTPDTSPNKSKATMKNSSSFTAELSPKQYSTFSIPRVSLNATKGVSVDVLKTTDDDGTDSTA